MIVLGIESTCDETGAAVVKDGKTILSNVLASSADIHEKYGGVFPELAAQRHIEAILPVIDEALSQAQILPEQLDLIAVAKGPGLIGSLLIGLNAAKGLAISLKKPLIGINHVEAHLYASMMDLETIPLPALGIVLSGGHTFIIQILNLGDYKLIGTTVDDAIGEAFDKTASLLKLPYPGGPHIEILAKRGNPDAYPFKAGHVKTNPLHFSFSGLKTAVLYALKKSPNAQAADLAASFQKCAFSDILKKIELARKNFPCQALYFGGGVTANQKLKEMVKTAFPDVAAFWPPLHLSLDNAAMIAGLAAKKYSGVSDPLDLESQVRIPFA